jgi:hypothetical protein
MCRKQEGRARKKWKKKCGRREEDGWECERAKAESADRRTISKSGSSLANHNTRQLAEEERGGRKNGRW